MSTANTSKQYYLGIDPSAASTGLALITVINGVPSNWDCTHIVPPKGLRGGARLNFIFDATVGFLSVHSVEILGNNLTRVCMEGASLFSTNKETVLSEVRGIFLLLSHQLGQREPAIIPPTQLKLFAAGSGSASKEEVVAAIKAGGCFDPQNDDEADACGLANMACALDHSATMPLTRPQLELILKLLQGKPLRAKLVKPKRTFDV